MNSTFQIGRRFLKIKYLCVITNVLVVAVFYFIYRYLLEETFPSFVNTPLAVIFLLIGLAAARITLWAADKFAVSYRVTGEGLVMVRGRAEQLLLWSGFTSAKLRPYSFQGVFPVEFQVGNRVLVLNQYIDGLCRLTGLILDHIRDHAEIDPVVEQRARDLLDVY